LDASVYHFNIKLASGQAGKGTGYQAGRLAGYQDTRRAADFRRWAQIWIMAVKIDQGHNSFLFRQDLQDLQDN